MTTYHPPKNHGAPPLRLLSLALLLCFLCVGAAVAADSRAGATIRGRVTNKATGDLLSEAIIVVDGTSLATTTNRSGEFALSVPAGPHTLVVEYSGLDTERVAVDAAPGETLERNMALSSAIYSMEKVTVKGLREGNSLAIQRQRTAPNEKVVVAADTYGNPAANPGELVQRMPNISADIVGNEVRTIFIRGMDPSFGVLLIDGEKVATSTGTGASRVYQIEQFGTANIESAELILSALPDMDANAIAGYVNLIPKRAFDLPGRRDTLTLGTLWRDRGPVSGNSPFKDRADNLDMIGVSHSDVYSVFGGKNNLGIAANINRRVSATTGDENGPGGLSFGSGDWNVTNPNNPLQRNFGSGELGYDAVSLNAAINVDYKVNADTAIFFTSSYNANVLYQHFFREWIQVPNSLASFTPDSTTQHQVALPVPTPVGNATLGSFAQTYSSNFDKHSTNYQLGLGGETKLFDRTATLKLNATYSYADIDYPQYVTTDSRAYGIGWSLDRTGNPEYPTFTQLSGPSVYDPASYKPDNYVNRHYSAPDRYMTLRADFQKDLDLPVPAYIKVGGKQTIDRRSQSLTINYFSHLGPDGIRNSGDEQNIVPYLGPDYKQAANHYGPFPFVVLPATGKPGDILSAPAGFWVQTPADAFNSESQSINQYAMFKETVTSAYAMAGLQLGKLKVTSGVRVEQTELEVTSNAINGAISSANPALTNEENRARARARYAGGAITKMTDYRNVFPGVHFVYEPINSLLFRASYNTSITRPPVANLLPNISINDAANSVSAGNPGLKPYTSDNFDVSIAKYFEPGGMISVGAFLKEVKDYFATFTSTIGSGPDNGFDGSYAGYTLSQARNIGNARFRGFDVSYQQQFTFLPGPLAGLGAFANFTYLQAQGNYGTTNQAAVLNLFTPRTGNAGISYVRYGLQARVLANYRGETPIVNGGTALAAIQRARTIYTVKLQYAVNANADIFLDIDNLTDEPTQNLLFQGNYRYFTSTQGVGYTAGMKLRF